MLNSDDILLSLNKYTNNEFPSSFLNETIQYFNTLNNSNIDIIPENKYALAGIRIYTMYFPCFMYLSKNKWKENITYRKLKLSLVQTNNLFNQFDGIKRNDFLICNNIHEKPGVYYLYIIPETTDDIKLLSSKEKYIIPYELQGCLLGIASLYFLEHQNLETYCSENYVTNSSKLYKDLNILKEKIKLLNPLIRDRVMVHSGLIYHFLGTVYSRDIDLLFIAKKLSEKSIESYFNNIDLSIVYPPGIKDSKSPYAYKQHWFRYKLPQLGGVPDIYTMLIDPEHHFYFMGIKCIDIYTTFKKSSSRNSALSILDTILLEKINNINYIKDYCIKNIAVRQGNANVSTNKIIAKNFQSVKSLLKEWYNIDVPISYLEKHFKKCEEVHNTIYFNQTAISDPLMTQLASFNRFVSQKYILKFSKNKESLFDIGSGKLTGASIYKKSNLKYVYGIEPSIYSIQLANEVILKYPDIHFNLTQGYGDRPFHVNRKFDVITLIFTIHYMVDNIHILLDNILRLSKKGTIIIITYINGSKLFPILKNKGKFEVKYENDIYWGVYAFNDKLTEINSNKIFPKVLFYMKDVYGIENGSEEYLIIPEFIKYNFITNGFKLLKHNTFLEEYNKIGHQSNPLLSFQKQILEYHEIMIFEF
jgi:SAM-dependent methyltransferase